MSKSSFQLVGLLSLKMNLIYGVVVVGCHIFAHCRSIASNINSISLDFSSLFLNLDYFFSQPRMSKPLLLII